MKEIKTCEEIYNDLYAESIATFYGTNETIEDATRRANIYAVQNTKKVWREQWQK